MMPYKSSNENSTDQDIEADTCRPPMAQVKILRRPKPMNQEQPPIENLSIQLPNASNVSRHNPKVNRKPDGASGMNNSPSIFSEDQWPSIADAAKCSIPQTNKLNNSKAKELPTFLNQDGFDSTPLISPKIISKSKQAHHLTSPLTDKKPTPLKSYKERADEYAKARLRILGSAFSEEERPGGHRSTK